ncbi:MAG: TonB-dependent receptor [Bacteroidia bacterium]|nr:TonB-dependent receptor [Bacteroidia bacterium]MCZ2249714.1 TonB-dependent receptor [Bacteroidia bacterium]
MTHNIIFTLCITILYINTSVGQNSLSGYIKDKDTEEALPGVSVYIPDLRVGTTTDKYGFYKIENLPALKLLIQISLLGYKPNNEVIDLNATSSRDFVLEPAATELHEIVVTGLSQHEEIRKTPYSMSSITSLQLKQNAGTNIIDALAHTAGVSQVTTGPGISKPIIRGLGYNRVVVVNDDIRQEGQQWGDEHGVEIDEYSVEKVEILKGPASLIYGSDAMAGVINILSSAYFPEGQISGNIQSTYQTNNGLVGLSLNASGNKSGKIWSIRGSRKIAHDYKNKYDSYVYNSRFQENGFSGVMGLNKSRGYVHLHYGLYQLIPGIIEGRRDSSGHFIRNVAINDSTEEQSQIGKRDFLRYNPEVPFQQVLHSKISLNSNILLHKGSLKTVLGWQQNQRKEFANIRDIHEYELFMNTNTLSYDARYTVPDIFQYQISCGIGGMYQQTENRAEEYIIPDYHLFDAGIYTLVNRKYNKLNVSGGIRYDMRTEQTKELWVDSLDLPTKPGMQNVTQKFKNMKLMFYGLSGSIGGSYQLNKFIYYKLNLSHGYRMPNIAELTAHGVHHGTMNYIIGSSSLKPENSWQLDNGFSCIAEHVTAEVSLFYNHVNNFIYLSKLSNHLGQDSLTDTYPTFTYKAAHAHLYGGEINIDFHPHPVHWLHFENRIDWVNAVHANMPDSMKYLPNIPPPRLAFEVRADLRSASRIIKNAYVKFEVQKYFSQQRYFKAYQTETATQGYTIINLGVGTDIVRKSSTLFSIYLNMINLTDIAYQSHLSRLKYLDINQVTSRHGVFNMGRNFTLKLIFPFYYK